MKWDGILTLKKKNLRSVRMRFVLRLESDGSGERSLRDPDCISERKTNTVAPDRVKIDRLLADYRAGSDGAFRQLYGCMSGCIRGICVRILRREEWADDVAQDVWLRIIPLRDTPRQIDNALSYLYQVTRNICTDFLRAHREHLSLDSLPMQFSDESGRNELPIASEFVALALDRLPDQYREILFLHYFCGYELPEIAAIEEVSDEAIWKRVSRARLRLREELARLIAREDDAVASLARTTANRMESER